MCQQLTVVAILTRLCNAAKSSAFFFAVVASNSLLNLPKTLSSA
jgi:hypothetical protein